VSFRVGLATEAPGEPDFAAEAETPPDGPPGEAEAAAVEGDEVAGFGAGVPAELAQPQTIAATAAVPRSRVAIG